MCNNYQFYLEHEAYCRLMQELALGIPTQQGELDMPPAEDVRISDVAHQGQCGRAGADAFRRRRSGIGSVARNIHQSAAAISSATSLL